jgi:hypothetical protein
MFASGGVDALISDPQAFDGTVFDDMRLNDLLDIRQRNAAVPDRLRVHNHGRTVLTLIQASGFVGANGRSNVGAGQRGFERPLQVSRSRGIAATARMAIGSLIAADE